ncbi:tyrosine-type recombinase/integrase [Citreicella sp. C3M06]|uniref:tyrosine-type recombinase/integrase n=1 Tax=Citreicella sp. C3M06 TaxID=2841564 RepID=UPI001C08840A|nr:tyrosine-type recombinase/integrase [Citreicella sp. C3M06]MBU2963365.1 tyrosine-type recombinase/integrase [Citreicella sp. C3M06]
MKIRYPGLLAEKLPSGAIRYRVRVEGDKARRIPLSVTPDHPQFVEIYRAARGGVTLAPEATPEERAIRYSIGWIAAKHLAAMERDVEAGATSPLTLKKRAGVMKVLTDRYSDYAMKMPQAKLIALRDEFNATPARADSIIEGVRSMYRWACERGLCEVNPAVGIGRIDPGKGGAVPWSSDDLRKFRIRHPAGTTPHLCLTLLMFTACRIGDAIWLGRGNETTVQGVQALKWQPAKRGSAEVTIPMLPPLHRATRAAAVQGKTYLLNSKGAAFSTPDSLGNMFRRWCGSAGLQGRSAHGVRKAAGHLLAQEGCSQYQIMTIHGHTQAQTSEIYTKGVERWKMARAAMAALEEMDW